MTDLTPFTIRAALGAALSTDPDRRPFFDAFAGQFDRFAALWDGIDSAFTDWLIAQLPDDGRRAVDLGCGTGRHTVLLADRFGEVLAVDVADGMLEIARHDRARPNIDYQRRDVLGVDPRLAGRFDAAVSVHTLHHAGDPDRVLPAVRSLVAPGGVAVLADIIDPGNWATPEFHVDRAFADARNAYDMTGEPSAPHTVLDLLLHPHWLAQAAVHTPLTLAEFRRHYTAAFPGVTITTDLHPLMAAAVWRNPGPPPS